MVTTSPQICAGSLRILTKNHTSLTRNIYISGIRRPTRASSERECNEQRATSSEPQGTEHYTGSADLLDCRASESANRNEQRAPNIEPTATEQATGPEKQRATSADLLDCRANESAKQTTASNEHRTTSHRTGYWARKSTSNEQRCTRYRANILDIYIYVSENLRESKRI